MKLSEIVAPVILIIVVAIALLQIGSLVSQVANFQVCTTTWQW